MSSCYGQKVFYYMAWGLSIKIFYFILSCDSLHVKIQ